MAQMGVADVAKDLGTYHAMAGIRFFAYVIGVERLEIAGPATTGIELLRMTSTVNCRMTARARMRCARWMTATT